MQESSSDMVTTESIFQRGENKRQVFFLFYIFNPYVQRDAELQVVSFELCLFKCSIGHLILKLGTQTHLRLKIYLYQIYYFFRKCVNFLSFRTQMAQVKTKIKIETGAPSEEVMIVAEKELRETPERVKEATKALRELLRGW